MDQHKKIEATCSDCGKKWIKRYRVEWLGKCKACTNKRPSAIKGVIRKPMAKCLKCGKESRWIKESLVCRQCFDKNRPKGESHYKWQGGISRAYKTGYYSIEYRKWRQDVFKRDNYTCKNCGDTGFVTAHHIKSFAHFPELRFNLNNGLTLCEPCHSKTDNYKGRKINNKLKLIA